MLYWCDESCLAQQQRLTIAGSRRPTQGRIMSMKQFLTGFFLSGTLALSAFAAPLSSNARTVVPSAVQQMISVDYRALRDSPSAHALKDRVLPDTVKEFETALKATGIDPEK